MQQIVINCSSTYFGRLYAHHQEVRLCFTAYGFLSFCSCCGAGELGGEMLLATSSSQCTHLATRLSSITTATTGQKTIGSDTQSDLLMMGVKALETC